MAVVVSRRDRTPAPSSRGVRRLLGPRLAALRGSAAGPPPDVLITVPRSACRMLDFHKAEEVIALGRRLAADALDLVADDVQQTGSLALR